MAREVKVETPTIKRGRSFLLYAKVYQNHRGKSILGICPRAFSGFQSENKILKKKHEIIPNIRISTQKRTQLRFR